MNGHANVSNWIAGGIAGLLCCGSFLLLALGREVPKSMEVLTLVAVGNALGYRVHRLEKPAGLPVDIDTDTTTTTSSRTRGSVPDNGTTEGARTNTGS